MNQYRLYDAEGFCFYKWKFSSWSDADNFRHLMGRPDWTIRKVY